MRTLLFMVMLVLTAYRCAQADDWHTAWDGTLYGYATGVVLEDGSMLNPGNRYANLAQRSDTAEARFDLKADNGLLRLSARAIVLTRDARNAYGTRHDNDAYLSLWQASLRPSATWSVSAGRELLNWGPAQFRSPSNPFYFDNGRSDPMRELSGMDALKFAWTPDVNDALSLVRIAGSGHASPHPDPWHSGWLANWDRRGEDWAAGIALARAMGRAAFVGLHAQKTLGDAWLVYGEAGSGTRGNELVSPPDTALPFMLQNESPRRTDWSLGASYTRNNGQSLYAEFLHHGSGYHADEERAYYSRAAASPFAAGLALGYAPPLLGRDYLHLVWQSNLMESGGYWRAMATHSFSDNGNELSGYGEYLLGGQVSAFALGVLPFGSAQQEFSALLQRSLTVGLKLALP